MSYNTNTIFLIPSFVMMEFFKTINTSVSKEKLHQLFTLQNLENYTNLVFKIGSLNQNEAEIGGIWGEFTLLRIETINGVRFLLKECPYALT